MVALIPSLAFADDTYQRPVFGKYGFENHKNRDLYKQYIGKTVMYIPCRPLSYTEKNIFKTEKFKPGAEYIITDITTQNWPTQNLNLTFQEKNSNKKLKIKTRDDYSYLLPFFFIDDFNADKDKLIGKTFTDPFVKGEYKITDVKLEDTNNGERIKEIVYDVSNSEIKRSFRTTDYEATIAKFINEDKSGLFHTKLVKVEKPEDSSERYGQVKVVDDKGITKYSFEDDFITIIIFADDTKFSFKLINKTQNSIKIVWDDAVFVDFNGVTSKVIHSGVKYNERETSQVATTIISGASLEDIACPTSYIRYDEYLKEWVSDSMFPNSFTKTENQIRLMLPIQLKDVVNEYVFIFDVKYKYNYPERLKL